MDAEVRRAAERLIEHGSCGRSCAYRVDKSTPDILAVARYVLSAAERPKGDAAEIERLECQVRILEQAINWTIVDMEWDCHKGSIGAAWRDRLKDARSRAQNLASPSPEGAARSGHPDDATP